MAETIFMIMMCEGEYEETDVPIGWAATREEAEAFLDDEACPMGAWIRKLKRVTPSGRPTKRVYAVRHVNGSTQVRSPQRWDKETSIGEYRLDEYRYDVYRGQALFEEGFPEEEAIALVERSLRDLQTPHRWVVWNGRQEEEFECLEDAEAYYEGLGDQRKILTEWTKGLFAHRYDWALLRGREIASHFPTADLGTGRRES